MKMPQIFSSILAAAALTFSSCSDGEPSTPQQPDPDPVIPVKETGFARGADVSWLTQMESEGLRFYTPAPERREMELMALNNAGYDAVKAVFPEAKVIVHLDAGNDRWRYDRMFGLLEDNGGKYDMIGMSLYPYWAEEQGQPGGWKKIVDDCVANISYLKERYGRPVMICEIGMPHDKAELCRDLIARMMTTPVEGIFYWEPEAPAGYNGGYGMGCFENGSPTVALDPFRK